MRKKSASQHRKPQRRLSLEPLESRHLLSVNGFQIDLSENLDDLLGPNSGGIVQTEYAIQDGSGGTISGSLTGSGFTPSSLSAVEIAIAENDGEVDITSQLLESATGFQAVECGNAASGRSG